MDYKDITHLQRQVNKLLAQQARQMPKFNRTAAAPTTGDDANDGYSIGSLWVDTSTSPANLYVCVDASAGAADWDLITTT
jgi:hypothetical protein